MCAPGGEGTKRRVREGGGVMKQGCSRGILTGGKAQVVERAVGSEEKGRGRGQPTGRCPTPGSPRSEGRERGVTERTLLGKRERVATGVGKFGEPERLQAQ